MAGLFLFFFSSIGSNMEWCYTLEQHSLENRPWLQMSTSRWTDSFKHDPQFSSHLVFDPWNYTTTILHKHVCITENKEKANVIKTAQGPPHLSVNNPFLKFLFFGLEQKTKHFSFSASSSSQLHSERGNFYFLFINLCSFLFFFLPSKKIFFFSRSDFFVEMWKIDVLICTWIVGSGCRVFSR